MICSLLSALGHVPYKQAWPWQVCVGCLVKDHFFLNIIKGAWRLKSVAFFHFSIAFMFCRRHAMCHKVSCHSWCLCSGGPFGAMGTLENAKRAVSGNLCNTTKVASKLIINEEPRDEAQVVAHTLRHLLLQHLEQRAWLNNKVIPIKSKDEDFIVDRHQQACRHFIPLLWCCKCALRQACYCCLSPCCGHVCLLVASLEG